MTDLTYDPTHVYTAEEIIARRAAFDAAVQQDTAARAASMFDAATGKPVYSVGGTDVYQLPDIAVRTGPPWPLLIAGGILLWILLDNDKRGGGRGDF